MRRRGRLRSRRRLHGICRLNGRRRLHGICRLNERRRLHGIWRLNERRRLHGICRLNGRRQSRGIRTLNKRRPLNEAPRRCPPRAPPRSLLPLRKGLQLQHRRGMNQANRPCIARDLRPSRSSCRQSWYRSRPAAPRPPRRVHRLSKRSGQPGRVAHARSRRPANRWCRWKPTRARRPSSAQGAAFPWGVV